MVTMAHSAANWRNTHTHMARSSRIYTHLQQHSYNHVVRSARSAIACQCMLGFFRVSVIHRTLTLATGSLSCVRDHSCDCVYTRGLDIPTASQHNISDGKKSQVVLVLLTGFEPRSFGSRVRRSTKPATLSHVSNHITG